MEWVRCLVLNFAVAQLAAGSAAQAQESLAVFGQLNEPGSVTYESPLRDGTHWVGGAEFRVLNGQISANSDLSLANVGRFSIREDGKVQRIYIKPRHICVDDDAGFSEVMKLDARDRAGLTLCLAPGTYSPQPADLFDRFSAPLPSEPFTVTSSDPNNRAQLSQWFVGSRKDEVQGNLVLKGLDFAAFSPELPEGSANSWGQKVTIWIGHGTPAKDVTIDDIRVIGNLREARIGGRSPEKHLVGITASGEGITIKNSRFERITDAINISGENIKIFRNRVRHHWGDFLRISGQRLKSGCRDSRWILVKDNIVSDHWSNFRLHPDVVHIFPTHNISCGIDRLTIEGTIAYIGEGARQPAWPTNLENMVPVSAPIELDEREKQLWKIVGQGDVVLPVANCPDRPNSIGVQLQPGAGPITLRPPPNQELRRGKSQISGFTMKNDWETWTLLCPGKGRNRWDLRIDIPSMQGIFSNPVPGPKGYTNVVVRNNIIWSNSVHGVSFRGHDHENVTITNNSLLQIWPGDINGDGRANTPTDGFNTELSSPRVLTAGKGPFFVERNVTGDLRYAAKDAATRLNDESITHTDNGASMNARFRPLQPGVFFPWTPEEAVAIARPRVGGPLDGKRIGAVATYAANDWYDWSWVRNDAP